MTAPSNTHFKSQYERHLKHLQLKGLQPKTIDAYARAIRRIGGYFDYWLDDLSEAQLLNYFADLLQTHSWSAAKLDLYGLKFFYTHVLKKPWVELDLVKAPKAQRLPDIVTVDQVRQLVAATRVRSYQVLFFTLYSLGLRLGEGLRLQVGDIDADRQRVHVRNAKGNKDRLVPLPDATLVQLRAFWRLHRHPTFLFPNRHGGLAAAATAQSPLDRGGVQQTLKRVVADCRIKKRSPRTACATATPPICWKPASIC
jgi:site-specific recombinase XerD